MDDHVCHIYSKISEENFPIVLYSFQESKTSDFIFNNFKQSLTNINSQFRDTQESFHKIKEENQENQIQIESAKQKIKIANNNLGSLGLQSSTFSSLLGFSILAWYPLTGILTMYVAWGRWIGSDFPLVVLWPLEILWPMHFGSRMVIFKAMIYGLLPAILILIASYWSKVRHSFRRQGLEHLISQQMQKISTLRERNSEIQYTLNQTERLYEELKQKKTDTENKIAYFESEMKRVQAL